MARYTTHDSYESCEPRSIKAVDSIHIAKLRREQEELQNQPMKAVDSIAVTKARREQAKREKENDQVEREVSNFSARANTMYQQKKEQREKANRALKKLREDWLNKVRRSDVKPENLRAMMQGHLDAEDKLMRSFLRMWTTADFSPIAVLGQGSFGTVHLVRCTSNEQIYALKCMSKAYYKRKNSLAMNERDALLGDGLLDKTDRWCARLMCSFQVTTAREKDSPEVWRLLEEIDEKETEVTEQMQRRAELQELLATMEEELSSTRKDLKASQQRADQWRRLKDEKERELFAQIRKREDAEREASFLRQSAWLADRTARENVALKKQLQKATAASRAAGALPKQIAEMECSPLRCCRGDARPTIKKKLMMKWHPDKQPTAEHVEFATQVMQAMQNQPEWE